MTDAEWSIDDGGTFEPIELDVTARITDGINIVGINFTSDNEDLPRFVDSQSGFVMIVPEVSDDPLVGHLHMQGADYLFSVDR